MKNRDNLLMICLHKWSVKCTQERILWPSFFIKYSTFFQIEWPVSQCILFIIFNIVEGSQYLVEVEVAIQVVFVYFNVFPWWWMVFSLTLIYILISLFCKYIVGHSTAAHLIEFFPRLLCFQICKCQSESKIWPFFACKDLSFYFRIITSTWKWVECPA